MNFQPWLNITPHLVSIYTKRGKQSFFVKKKTKKKAANHGDGAYLKIGPSTISTSLVWPVEFYSFP